jgi:hypothetical protein
LIEFNREWAMPSKNTFEIKPIKKFIEENITGEVILNPFANRSKYGITNDLDTEQDTDFHLDALDFLQQYEDNSVDFILYDPPFSPRQVSECYKSLDMTVNMQTTQSSYWSKQKKEISRVLKTGGKVITFGWNTGGIGKGNGFVIQKILLVAHGGWHNDTLCTLEEKVKG